MTIDMAFSMIAARRPGEFLFVLGAIYLATLLSLRRRWVASLSILSLGFLWLAFYLSAYEYLNALSADSFVEAQNFDLNEARFWWLTLREGVFAELSPQKLGFYSAIAAVSFGIAHLIPWRKKPIVQSGWAWANATVPVLLMALAVYVTTAEVISRYAKNSHGFKATVANFQQPLPTLSFARHPMDVVVYIGEATTVRNMSLYGYPRDTTPRLSALARQDDSLLVFRNVFSTHTHTAQSLLEALSFGVDPTEDVLPIARRRRIALPTVLARASVETRLLSNQGLRGAYEEARTIIFRDSVATLRLEQDLAARRTGAALPSRWDHEFFQTELAREGPSEGVPRVTFLHSYSGHGPYLENIPPTFRLPVDSTFSGLPREKILNDPRRKVKHVEDYDSAVRYVDHSVSTVAEQVRGRRRPTVFLYFADHGEMVFSEVGHDSARFKHEVARVPFLLYFNEAARREYPAVFSRYQSLSRTREIATLAQLPSTLLDLLGIEPEQGSGVHLGVLPIIGSSAASPPIVVREQGSGISYINLNVKSFPSHTPSGEPLTERRDPDTEKFLDLQHGKVSVADLCGGVPRNLEELSRRILIAGCTPAAGPPWTAAIAAEPIEVKAASVDAR